MVIFSDLSEVFCHGIYGMEEAATSLYSKDIGETLWRSHEALNGKVLELFRKEFSEDHYWEEVLLSSGLPMSLSEAKNVLTENIRRVIPGTLDVYKSITAHPKSLGSSEMLDGRPDIYIVSDHIAERIEQLKTIHPDIFGIVKGCFWSCDLGYIKQDAEFFPKVLAATQIPIEEIVFVDDIEQNAESARRHGIYSIVFYDAMQLKQELSKIGFRFAE